LICFSGPSEDVALWIGYGGLNDAVAGSEDWLAAEAQFANGSAASVIAALLMN
jgi:hypothetical protein